MSKQLLFSILVCLLVILGACALVYKKDLLNFGSTSGTVSPTPSPSPSGSAANATLPIALNNPSVGSALVHYFLSGTLEEVKKTGDGYVLLLAGSKDLPALALQPATRISKITPPYGPNTSVPLKVTDLKKGMVVDISTEYNLNEKSWVINDVFVPTDKNK